ncbi:MAG TPA: protein kinase family protein [Streptosporangiaceae bacterium]|nr:protein kinase family protein [Streptosporangiaceae bacterium]
MSTFISEPGTRLGGRYRLEDRIAAAGGWAAWKAIDEILARAVTVFTFAPGFPRIREVVTAARAASRLTDARLTQVFDVEDDWDRAYIVMEWAVGEPLDDLLAAGPLDPSSGAQIVAEAAAALSVAHAAGLAHLCLVPGSLRWTPGGGVKIVGLGIDAALAGTTVDDPALADTRGLARLLYAALTGHWPGPDGAALPTAPVADGLPRSPRQVRAGVPTALDDITCRALFQQDRRGGSALTTPGQLAGALAAVIPRTPPPTAAPPMAPWRAVEFGDTGPIPGGDGEYWPRDGVAAGQRDRARPQRSGGRPSRQGGRPPVSGIKVGVVVVLVLAVVAAVTAAALALRPTHQPGRQGGHSPSASATGSAAATVLVPQQARGFQETSNGAGLAIDNRPGTAWQTQYYIGNPVFGGLKTGSGLILDMGKAVGLSSVTIQFGPTFGANVAIEVGNDGSRTRASLATFTTVAQADNLGGTHTFSSQSTATGRYVLIWFTRLPPEAHGPKNHYEAEIFNIIVKGSG